MITETVDYALRGLRPMERKDYLHEVETLYIGKLFPEVGEFDLKVVEEKDDPDATTFELYYEGRFLASGKLSEFARVKAIIENTFRVFPPTK